MEHPVLDDRTGRVHLQHLAVDGGREPESRRLETSRAALIASPARSRASGLSDDVAISSDSGWASSGVRPASGMVPGAKRLTRTASDSPTGTRLAGGCRRGSTRGGGPSYSSERTRQCAPTRRTAGQRIPNKRAEIEDAGDRAARRRLLRVDRRARLGRARSSSDGGRDRRSPMARASSRTSVVGDCVAKVMDARFVGGWGLGSGGSPPAIPRPRSRWPGDAASRRSSASAGARPCPQSATVGPGPRTAPASAA